MARSVPQGKATKTGTTTKPAKTPKVPRARKTADATGSTKRMRPTRTTKTTKTAKPAKTTKAVRPAGPAKKEGSRAASGRGAAPGAPPLSGWTRAMAMLAAFVGTVVFAVLLARLTLEPSAASVSLTHSNLRPGDSIRDYLSQPAFRDTVKQLGGNIVLGMPFGMLLPVLVPRARGLIRVTFATALVMFLVELAQGFLVTGRAFDVDDVLLNTTGAVLGYLLIGRRLGRAVHPRRRHWWHRFTKRTTAAE
ncbi:VanZ family protein [Streptomyces sp. NPDC055060]